MARISPRDMPILIPDGYRRADIAGQIAGVEEAIREFEFQVAAGKRHKGNAALPLWQLKSALLTLRDLQTQPTNPSP